MLIDSTGTAQWVGYCPYLAGISGSFFSGTPGESTAYFTFRSMPFQEQTIANGNLTQLFPTSAAGPVQIGVYLNLAPSGNFQTPDTFSAGQLIANLQPQRAMGTFSGALATAAGTYNVVSSVNFTFGGQTYNLAELTPALTVSLLFGAPTAGTYGGSSQIASSFGGYALAVGKTPVIR
jgi:hypothetical protein